MIGTPQWSRFTRATTGVVAAATAVFTVGVTVAGSAHAAASAITATADQPSYPIGATASITVDPTGAPHRLSYVIESGPDQSGPDASPCGAVGADGTATCSFTNGGTEGTDTIRVFDDLDDSGTYNNGEPSAVVSIVFYGDPATVGLSTAGNSTSVENCKVYTVTARDAKGNAAEQADIDLTLTSTGANDAMPTFCTGSGVPVSPAQTAKTVTTDSDGSATFSATGLATGTIRVDAASALDATVNDSASFSVTGGKHTADDVKSLVITPTSAVGAAAGSVAFTATATDANGDPVGDVVVRYQITSGPDQTSPGTYKTCDAPTVQATGMTTCTVHNSHAGTDAITFFVNQDTQPTQTPGPDQGEPQMDVSVKFQVEPTYTNIAITCPDQTLANGGARANCVVPLSPATTTFTARVVNGQNAAGNGIPVPNAVVNFTVGAGDQGAKATPKAGSAVTDANGVATFDVTDVSAADNDVINVSAIVGNGSTFDNQSPYAGNESDNGSVTYERATANYLNLYPSVQTATVHADVTETATVLDQFGNPVANDKVNFLVFAGRNSGQNANIRTGADGTAVFTYTDMGPGSSTGQDQIFASEANNGESDIAEVDYITSGTAVGDVIVSLDACNPAHPVTSETDYVTQYGENEVCATVTNGSGVRLAGKQVTFSVDKGFLTPGVDELDSTFGVDNKTLTTDANGQAHLFSGSRVNGDQTITVTSESQTGTATIQYVNFGTSIVLTPASAQITAGGAQRFTATVRDQFGNLVPGQEVDFSVAGPGTLSNPIVFTTGDGTANEDVSVPATATGAGTVTASLPGTATGTCGSIPGAVCTDSSDYTITQAPSASSLDLSAPASVTAGDLVTATATVKNDDNSPGAGLTVNFVVSGADSATGSATTGSDGTAGFTFTATHAGMDTITAYADVNGNGIQDSDEPGDTTTVTVKAIPVIYISSTKDTAPRPATFNIYGSVHPASGAGQTVQLQQYYPSLHTWKTIQSQALALRALPSGNTAVGYNFTVNKDTVFTYSFRVFWPAASDHLAGYSATKQVRVTAPVVAPTIYISSTKYTVAKPATFGVYGSVHPSDAGQTVYLQQYYPALHKWQNIQSQALRLQTLPSGTHAVGYNFTVHKNTTYTYQFRVYWPKATDHFGGYSRTISVKVM